MMNNFIGKKEMGRVDGKVAIVTGAGSGLGEAIACLLAKEGASVVIADINEKAGNDVADKIRGLGGDAVYSNLDVSNEESWKLIMQEVLSRFGRLNVLVNNAGIAPPGSMEISLELWRKVMSVNLDGTFLGIKYAIAAMESSRQRGSIVNISSVMAMIANSSSASYSASKGGVRSLTKAAAMYCAENKLPIRVNSVHPGTCDTPLVRSYYDTQPTEAISEAIAKHPIGHFGEAIDVAYGVLYLASDESKFVLGTELVIDGGWLASD